MKPVRIAMVGVGAISGIYLKNITHTFKEIELVGLCDLVPERAEKGAAYVRDAIANGAKAPEPKIYKDMYEAFNDPEAAEKAKAMFLKDTPDSPIAEEKEEGGAGHE